MAAITEAACLLESGALYARRVAFSAPDAPVFLGVKQGAFSIYFGDGPFYHFDLDGRWQRILQDGIHYLKGLDTVVRSIDRKREGANLVLKRRVLSYAEVVDLDESVRQMALGLLERVECEHWARLEPPAKTGVEPLSSSEVCHRLSEIASWDVNAWFSHRERYLATYAPLPFVPPECMNPLHVQATIGSTGGTGFGGLKAPELAARTPDEFRTHLKSVAKLMRGRVSQMRQVYLSGPDALLQPVDTVAAYLDALNETFPLSAQVYKGPTADQPFHEDQPKLDGVHALLVDFDAVAASGQNWARLREKGLKGVTLGIEAGSADRRTAFGRRWSVEQLIRVISDLHEAGIRSNLAVIAPRDDAAEVEAMARLVESLPLERGEIVSLIDPAELSGSVSDNAHEATATLKEALGAMKPRGVKVVPYLLEKQWI